MDARIKRMCKRLKEYRDAMKPTAFLLADGSEFTTDLDPLYYLLKHGTEAPRGPIVAYPHPVDGIDSLSLSLYELVDDEIKTGDLRATILEGNYDG